MPPHHLSLPDSTIGGPPPTITHPHNHHDRHGGVVLHTQLPISPKILPKCCLKLWNIILHFNSMFYN